MQPHLFFIDVRMKRIGTLLLSCVVSLSVLAQTTRELYEDYISTYCRLAQQQQTQFGIPACITLAQGLLESGAGRSVLAQKANNHFGIKCTSDWAGATFHQDDDTKDECFRKYKKVEDSYRDHSLFLQRPRYAELFTLQLTDYKGWAHGLKRCGYATDPAYAGKLIKLIEDYDLVRYVADAGTASASSQPVADKEKTTSKHATKSQPKNSKKTKHTAPTVPEKDTLSVSPSEERKTKKTTMGTVNLYDEHKVLRNNMRRYVVAREGDTFQSIAMEFNITPEALYKYNDVRNKDYVLREGDKVYLQLKRTKAAKRYAVYRVRKGENMWQIAQDKGIQIKRIYSLNGIAEGQDVSVNQELRLR